MSETTWFIERRNPGNETWHPVEESSIRPDWALKSLRDEHYIDEAKGRPVPEYRMVRIKRKVYDL